MRLHVKDCIILVVNTILLFVFTLFSLISFGGILWGADPYTSGALIKTLFFVTLFFAATGVFSLGGVWFSRLVKKALTLEAALRKGILLAMLFVAIVALEAGSILNIGNAFAVFMLVITLEMLAISRNIKHGT